MLKGGVLTNSQSRPKSDGARNFAQGGIMNFPDVLRTVCGTRLPIPQSAFGIDLTLPLPRPYTSLGTQHRCPSGFGPPWIWTPRFKSASGYGSPGPNLLADLDLPPPNKTE